MNAVMMPKRSAIRTFIVIATLVFVALSGCTPKATEDEIGKMCDRLLALRGKESDPSMKATCMAEAKNEGISQRQAQCRISAVNTQEYWHRCRTGEARD